MSSISYMAPDYPRLDQDTHVDKLVGNAFGWPFRDLIDDLVGMSVGTLLGNLIAQRGWIFQRQ